MLKFSLRHIACLLLLIFAFFGCHKAEIRKEITVAVPGWYAPEKMEPLATAIEKWNKTHPDNKVVIKVMFGKKETFKQKIYLGAGREDFADAVLVRNEWVGTMVANDLVAPLSHMTAREVRDRALPAITDSISDSKNVWAMPFDADVLLLWYRKDMVPDQEGIFCKSFGDLTIFLLGNKEKDGRRYGFAFPAARSPNSAIHFFPWYFAHGGRLIDDNGEMMFDPKAAAKALSWLKSTVENGAAPKSVSALEQNGVFSGLAGGQFDVTVGGNWERKMLERKSKLSEKISSAVIPDSNGGQGVSLMGGWSFVLTKNNQAKTELFLKTLFEENVQREKLEKFSLLPVLVSLLDGPWFDNNPDGPAFKTALKTASTLGFSSKTELLLQQVSIMLAQVFLGKKEPLAAANEVSGI